MKESALCSGHLHCTSIDDFLLLLSLSSIVPPCFCLPLHFGLVNRFTQRTIPMIPYNQTETSENRKKKTTKQGYYSKDISIYNI